MKPNILTKIGPKDEMFLNLEKQSTFKLDELKFRWNSWKNSLVRSTIVETIAFSSLVVASLPRLSSLPLFPNSNDGGQNNPRKNSALAFRLINPSVASTSEKVTNFLFPLSLPSFLPSLPLFPVSGRKTGIIRGRLHDEYNFHSTSPTWEQQRVWTRTVSVLYPVYYATVPRSFPFLLFQNYATRHNSLSPLNCPERKCWYAWNEGRVKGFFFHFLIRRSRMSGVARCPGLQWQRTDFDSGEMNLP